MQNLKIPIIYENEDLIVYDKPAGLNSDDIPKRIHRLDKDTSGILLAAKNDKTLEFLQDQFKQRKVEKKYLALTVGNLKDREGEVKTMLGRAPKDRRKQKAYLINEPGADRKREAETRYKVLQKFKNYDLIEARPLSGRKHQIRAHLSFLGHPIAGDKMYGFKNQPVPEGLKRHFLHASYLKIRLTNEETKEFQAELPKDLKNVLEFLN